MPCRVRFVSIQCIDAVLVTIISALGIAGQAYAVRAVIVGLSSVLVIQQLRTAFFGEFASNARKSRKRKILARLWRFTFLFSFSFAVASSIRRL